MNARIHRLRLALALAASASACGKESGVDLSIYSANLVDGQVVGELDAGDEVIIRRSRRTVRLVHLADNSFLEALRRKLQWRGTYL